MMKLSHPPGSEKEDAINPQSPTLSRVQVMVQASPGFLVDRSNHDIFVQWCVGWGTSMGSQ
jgi:hypothetical protein